MKTIKEIKNYIDKHQENKINDYGKFTIQVYAKTPNRQAAIFWNNEPLVKIEEREKDGLHIFLQNEDNENVIYYNKGCYLKDDEDIVKMYGLFKEHKNIENALASLLLLN